MPEILTEYRMKFEKVSAGEKAVPDGKDYGKRSKLGGFPDWDQDDETPTCPSCKKKMTFLCQIDSIDQNEIMFGDMGMVYIFWCIECFETKSLLQGG